MVANLLLILLGHEKGEECNAIKECLKPLAREITEARSTNEVLEFTRKKAFDCIVLSYEIPGEGLFDLIGQLHRDGVKSPILVVTNSSTETLIVKVSGANPISKGDVMTSLAETVSEMAEDFNKHEMLKHISKSAKKLTAKYAMV